MTALFSQPVLAGAIFLSHIAHFVDFLLLKLGHLKLKETKFCYMLLICISSRKINTSTNPLQLPPWVTQEKRLSIITSQIYERKMRI